MKDVHGKSITSEKVVEEMINTCILGPALMVGVAVAGLTIAVLAIPFALFTHDEPNYFGRRGRRW